MKNTCIKFEKRGGEADYVDLKNERGEGFCFDEGKAFIGLILIHKFVDAIRWLDDRLAKIRSCWRQMKLVKIKVLWAIYMF